MGNDGKRINVYYYDGEKEAFFKFLAWLIIIFICFYLLVYTFLFISNRFVEFIILFIAIFSLFIIRIKQQRRYKIKNVVKSIFASIIITIIIMYILFFTIGW